MVNTYAELLEAQTELAHFNPHHDPQTGKFVSSNLTNIHTESTSTTKKSKLKDLRKCILTGTAILLSVSPLFKGAKIMWSESRHNPDTPTQRYIDIGKKAVADSLIRFGGVELISSIIKRGG